MPAIDTRRNRGRLKSVARLLGDLLADVAKLGNRGLFEPFPTAGEMFVDLDRGLLHDRVGLLAAADEDEVVAPSQARMTVVIVKRNAE